eukprot:6082183-Lingulodinium_polyedra.AAC.1
MRPDLAVHVLCENAGTTRPEFRRTMGKTLGLSPANVGDHIVQSEAGAWTALPRLRMLLSTLPATQ